MNPKINIVVPVHNRIETTRKFALCLKKQSYENFHCFLIDDGSTDGTSDMVKEYISAVTVIKGKGKWWFGGCLHHAYLFLKNRLESDDIIFICNDDVEFDPFFFEKASTFFEFLKGHLILAPGYGQKSKKQIGTGVRIDWANLKFLAESEEIKITCFPTRGLFIHAQDYLMIGGMHPIILPHYLSDYEYTNRANRKGLKFQLAKDIKVIVDEGTTGVHDLNYSQRPDQFLKQLLSKRSSANPFYWSSFIFLACPSRWKALNLLRVWLLTLKRICKNISIWLGNSSQKR